MGLQVSTGDDAQAFWKLLSAQKVNVPIEMKDGSR